MSFESSAASTPPQAVVRPEKGDSAKTNCFSLRALGDGLVRFIYPPACVVCQSSIEQTGICSKCEDQLCEFAYVSLCPRCAATAGPHAFLVDGCHLCRNETFAFTNVFRLGSYRGLLKSVCLGMKQFGHHIMAPSMAHLLLRHRIQEIQKWKPDFVVSIPLHWTRRFIRGFDQAELLADVIAAELKIPMVKGRLARKVRTEPQALLTPTARRENVRNAFRCKPWSNWEGRRVLLVDDVLTTGATCHQAARALKQAGVKEVSVAVLARGEAAKG